MYARCLEACDEEKPFLDRDHPALRGSCLWPRVRAYIRRRCGNRTYLLDGDPAELKRVAGQRVQIVGALNGGTITVASVAPGT
jgi:hypothetical protein